jgi:hypothetical protein
MGRIVIRLAILAASLALGLFAENAAAQEKTRPATASDFAGLFSLLDYPSGSQPTS